MNSTDIQKDLQTLAAGLKQLEAEYNMFFAGRLPRPPWETRNRVAALVKKWDRGYIQTTMDRFQFDTLQRAVPDVHRSLGPRPALARGRARRPVRRAAGRRTCASRRSRTSRVVHVAAFQDPMREMDKLHTLYDSLMDARREAGEDVVPFQSFAALVKDQVTKLRRSAATRSRSGWRWRTEK